MTDLDQLQTQHAKLLYAIGQHTVIEREARATIELAHMQLQDIETQIAQAKAAQENQNGEG